MDEWVKTLQRELSATLPSGWRDDAPWGYPQQAELALIAGVYGAQVTQQGVAEVVDSYMRTASRMMLDDLTALANTPLAELIVGVGTRWGDTNVLGVPVLRIAVVREAAVALAGAGVVSAADYREAIEKREGELERLLLSIRGLGPGTWETIAFMMHAKVRPNEEVVAFLRRLLGDSGQDLVEEHVDELVRLTSRRFAVDQRVLVHAIEQYIDQRIR